MGLLSKLKHHVKKLISKRGSVYLKQEIKEEVNITVTDIKYFQSQSWPFPSQLMLGYFCKYTEGEIKLNDGELEDANWFELNDLPIIPPETSISGQLIRSYILDHSKL